MSGIPSVNVKRLDHASCIDGARELIPALHTQGPQQHGLGCHVNESDNSIQLTIGADNILATWNAAKPEEQTVASVKGSDIVASDVINSLWQTMSAPDLPSSSISFPTPSPCGKFVAFKLGNYLGLFHVHSTRFQVHQISDGSDFCFGWDSSSAYVAVVNQGAHRSSILVVSENFENSYMCNAVEWEAETSSMIQVPKNIGSSFGGADYLSVDTNGHITGSKVQIAESWIPASIMSSIQPQQYILQRCSMYHLDISDESDWSVDQIFLSPDGESLAALSMRGRIWLFKVSALIEGAPCKPVATRTTPVCTHRNVVWSPDSRMIVMASTSESLVLEAATLRITRRVATEKSVLGYAWCNSSMGASRLFIYSSGSRLHSIDFSKENLQQSIDMDGNERHDVQDIQQLGQFGLPVSAAYIPSNHQILILMDDGSLLLFDADTCRIVTRVEFEGIDAMEANKQLGLSMPPYDAWRKSASVSPNRPDIVTWSKNGVNFWKFRTDASRNLSALQHVAMIECALPSIVVWSPSGQFIAVGNRMSRLSIFSTNSLVSGEETTSSFKSVFEDRMYQISKKVCTVRFSEDESHIFVGLDGGEPSVLAFDKAAALNSTGETMDLKSSHGCCKLICKIGGCFKLRDVAWLDSKHIFAIFDSNITMFALEDASIKTLWTNVDGRDAAWEAIAFDSASNTVVSGSGVKMSVWSINVGDTRPSLKAIGLSNSFFSLSSSFLYCKPGMAIAVGKEAAVLSW